MGNANCVSQVAELFEERKDMLKVMQYLKLYVLIFLCKLNINGHFRHLQGSVSSQSG